MTKRDQLESAFLAHIRRGMTLPDAARAVGVHRSTAQRWLKRISDAEAVPARQKHRPRHWWDKDDPSQRQVYLALRDRLAALGHTMLDDPRTLFKVEASDDPVIRMLWSELCAGTRRQHEGNATHDR